MRLERIGVNKYHQMRRNVRDKRDLPETDDHEDNAFFQHVVH